MEALKTQLAAVLAYNGLSVEEGYLAVDLDHDGIVSRADLLGAIDVLQIHATPETIEAWFVEHAGGADFIPKDSWRAALNDTSGEDALKSLGIDVSKAGLDADNEQTQDTELVDANRTDDQRRNMLFAKQQILAVLDHNNLTVEAG
eukprot:3402709-Rhodomonas_salina.2